MNIQLLMSYLFSLLIYSFLGWIFETVYCSFVEGTFVKRGMLYGPYCPIYGFGAIGCIILLGNIENPFLLYLSGMITSVILEYITSYVLEKIFHQRWWDYSHMRYQIKGRISLAGALTFGAFAVIINKIIQPLINMALTMIASSPLILLVIILFMICIVITLLDISMTLIHLTHYENKYITIIYEKTPLKDILSKIEDK